MSALPRQKFSEDETKVAQNWCFTSFDLDKPHYDEAIMHYLCYQQETCPETGRLHWQGYMELKSQTRQPAAKALIGTDVWIHAKGRGAATDARDYCKKEKTSVAGTFEEFGVISTTRFAKEPRQPSGDKPASQQALMVAAIQKGASLQEVAARFPQSYMRNANGAKELILRQRIDSGALIAPKEVIVWWGPTRTGKTHALYKKLQESGEEAYWLKPSKEGKLWFTGYDGAAVIILDDFEGNMSMDDFLHLCDRYAGAQNWETKGGNTRLYHTKVYITSNSHPSTWFASYPPEKRAAAMARISKINHMIVMGNVNRQAAPVGPLRPYTPPGRMQRMVQLPPLPKKSVGTQTVTFIDEEDSIPPRNLEQTFKVEPLDQTYFERALQEVEECRDKPDIILPTPVEWVNDSSPPKWTNWQSIKDEDIEVIELD